MMDKDLVKEARKVKMKTLKKHGVYEKMKVEECGRERQTRDQSE